MSWIGSAPAFALGLDGTMFIDAGLFDDASNTERALAIAQQQAPRVFIGIPLAEADLALLRSRMRDAEAEAAAFIVGRRQRHEKP